MLKLLILVTILHLTTSQLAAINNPIIFVDDNLGFDDEDLVLPAVQTTFARALQPDCITTCGVSCGCPIGYPCSISEECITNNCVDGYCNYVVIDVVPITDASKPKKTKTTKIKTTTSTTTNPTTTRAPETTTTTTSKTKPIKTKTPKTTSTSTSTTASPTFTPNSTTCSPACQTGETCQWNTCTTAFWQAENFNDGVAGIGFSSRWNAQSIYGESNRYIVKDPINPTDNVLEIVYPAGSANPGGAIVGGTGVYATPISNLASFSNIVLEYKVLFPNGFDFVLGGKLPGIYGGRKSCSGGDPAKDCFSTRLMFRPFGAGEEYLYVYKPAQSPLLCRVNCKAHTAYGYSIGRGQYAFSTGQWNKVRQYIRLNTFTNGKYNQDGIFRLYFNDVLVIESLVVVYRIQPSINALGIDFQTFFGGNGKLYRSPTTQEAYFRGFKLGAY